MPEIDTKQRILADNFIRYIEFIQGRKLSISEKKDIHGLCFGLSATYSYMIKHKSGPYYKNLINIVATWDRGKRLNKYTFT